MTSNRWTTGDYVRMWIPVAVLVVVLVGGWVVGYVQLTSAVKAHSLAIDKQATALESITELMLSDTRQDIEIGHLMKALEQVRCDLRDHCRDHGRSGP